MKSVKKSVEEKSEKGTNLNHVRYGGLIGCSTDDAKAAFFVETSRVVSAEENNGNRAVGVREQSLHRR